MAEPNSDDSCWPEVRFINGYAMLIGFLQMGIRGLSVLVFTWTTVVLLGGFVSDLGKKDFWCLTAITLIQTFSAGVFHFLWKEKSTEKQNSLRILLSAVYTMAKDTPVLKRKRRKMFLLEFFLWLVKLLVLALVLGPLVGIYLVGLHISAGISVWRLIEHDYGNAQGAANQKPALNVLYSLAAAQGMFLSYQTLYTWVKRASLVEEVADSYSLDSNLVSEYLDETMTGCSNDPTFTRGRNVVTYAVELLMESKSNDINLSGVQILGTVLQWDFTFRGQADMIKQLLTRSTSFGHMIQRLIETMDTESPYSSEIKEHAATIVAHVADAIRLRYFPGGVQFLSVLLNTVVEYMWLHNRNEHARPEPTSSWPESDSNSPIHGCDWLVVQSLRIIQNLAADEDNCRIIIKTQGLIPKITAPLISHKLHKNHHDEWSEIAEEWMKLMSRLIAAPEETGEKFRSKISSNREAIISTLETILKCHKCALSLKIRAVEILLYPSVDTSPSIMATESSSRIFIWILLLVFLLTDARFEETRGFTHRINTGTNDDIRRLAGDKLSAVLPSQTQDTSTSQLVRVLGDLTEALVDTGSISNSIHAAKILRHLCFHYTRDDEYLKKLKEAIVHVMPKVLKGILGYGWTNEANNDGSESGGVSQCYGQENASCSRQQNCEQGEVGELREALISMCWAIHWRWNKTDPDTSQQLNRVAENICSEQGKPVKHFSDLVNEANEHLETGITRESATTVQIVVT